LTWLSVVVGLVQRSHSPDVEEPVGPGVGVASAYPMDTKDRLDHRNQGTGGVAANEQEGDNPMVIATLGFAVDFRQVVDPT